MSNQAFREYIVDRKESGQKLLTFLTDRLKQEGKALSIRAVKRAIEGHLCRINDRPESFATTLVATDDRIELRLPTIEVRSASRFDPARVLYEDEFLFVYDKPSAVVCDETGILALLRQNKPESILVHRLDKDTTGAMIVAKNRAIFDALVVSFKEFSVRKRYLAIADGIVEKRKGTIENAIGKIRSYAGQTIRGAVPASKGLYACTRWERLKTGASSSLLACYPVTGRTHQIRVHLSEAGHPILGDVQYAAIFECPYIPPRYLLHSEEVSFIHPVKKTRLTISAPIPDDFEEASAELFSERYS